jgi:hypothetical protein
MQSVLQLRVNVEEDAFRVAWAHFIRSTSIPPTRTVQHSKLDLLLVVEDVQWVEAEGLDKYLQRDRATFMELGELDRSCGYGSN